MMTAPDFWGNRERAQQLVEEVSQLRGKINPLLAIERQVDDLEMLKALAAEGHRPPHEWCEPAFRLLYKNMVTHGHPQDIVRYFRLMHAMGYRPPDHAWWDRFLQFHFYKQHAASREADGAGMMTQEMEQIRQAVAAVMAAPPV